MRPFNGAPLSRPAWSGLFLLILWQTGLCGRFDFAGAASQLVYEELGERFMRVWLATLVTLVIAATLAITATTPPAPRDPKFTMACSVCRAR
jgi:hypothetical protein